MDAECGKCATRTPKPPAGGLPEGWGSLQHKRTSQVQTFRDLCPTCLTPVLELVG